MKVKLKLDVVYGEQDGSIHTLPAGGIYELYGRVGSDGATLMLDDGSPVYVLPAEIEIFKEEEGK